MHCWENSLVCVYVPGESGVCVCMCAERLGLCTVRVRLSSRFQGHSVDDRALALPSLSYSIVASEVILSQRTDRVFPVAFRFVASWRRVRSGGVGVWSGA